MDLIQIDARNCQVVPGSEIMFRQKGIGNSVFRLNWTFADIDAFSKMSMTPTMTIVTLSTMTTNTTTSQVPMTTKTTTSIVTKLTTTSIMKAPSTKAKPFLNG